MSVLVYLAGASREHARVKLWANAIDRARSIELTDRWFDDAEQWTATDTALSRRQQALIAEREQQAIRAARIFWLLWPSGELTSSALVEFGFALAHRFHVARSYDVIVSGLGVERSIFTSLADYRSDSDALAFATVLDAAGRQLPPGVEVRR